MGASLRGDDREHDAPGLRGVYLGTATSWIGLSLAPAVGLQTRALVGDAGMWLLVAAIGASGAALYVVA